MSLSAAEQAKLISVANALGCNAQDLSDLIEFESGWKPTAANSASSARGLIQWMSATAKSLGYADSTDLITKNPTRIQQLDLVYKTLKPYYPLSTRQSVFMAVFYPKFRNVDSSTAFPTAVTAVNPGIKTVADYIAKVNQHIKLNRIIVTASTSVLPLLIAGFAVYWFLLRSR